VGKRKKRIRRKTMFGPPKHKNLAQITTIENPIKASEAARQLMKQTKRLKRSSSILRRAYSAQLAANRARAQLKRKNLSSKERAEMREVAAIWDYTAKKLFSLYHRKREGR